MSVFGVREIQHSVSRRLLRLIVDKVHATKSVRVNYTSLKVGDFLVMSIETEDGDAAA